MNKRKALIVEDDLAVLETIIATLDDAGMPGITVCSQDAARQHLEQDQGISLVILRGFGADICGTQICREIRQMRSPEQLTIIVMLREEELATGAEFLIAGASDLLIGFFEPRELRMRAGIVPTDQLQRTDRAHSRAIESGGCVDEPEFIIPQFDADTMRFCLPGGPQQTSNLEQDPHVRRVALDKIIVCPECEALPTFRPGCGTCGSAWLEREIRIHHYACAYVGPEREFVAESGLRCPKCRLTDLVAGSDFEQVKGCLRCADCAAVVAQPTMICHCLACHNRFMSEDGIVQSVYGYQIGPSADSTAIAAPRFHTPSERLRRSVSHS